MKNYTPYDIPIAKREVLSQSMYPITPKEKEGMDKKPYARVIRCLIYTVVCIRPNTYYIIGLVSYFQLNPKI